MKTLTMSVGLVCSLIGGSVQAQPRRAQSSRFLGSYETAMQVPVNYDMANGASGAELGSQDLQAPLNASLPAVTRCVAQETARGATLASVAVRVVVASDGRAIGVTVDQGSAAFRSCVTTVVRRAHWRTWNGPRMAFSWGFELQ